MIRLLHWHTLSWKAKKKNQPRLEDLHNALPVNVPSAIVIAVGFPTSITLTDALSINTGSCVNAPTIGVAWAFFDALMLPADTPLPMRQLKLRKARELSPLPFLIHLLIAGSCPYLEYAARAPCALSCKPTQCHPATFPLQDINSTFRSTGPFHNKAYSLEYPPLAWSAQ